MQHRGFEKEVQEAVQKDGRPEAPIAVTLSVQRALVVCIGAVQNRAHSISRADIVAGGVKERDQYYTWKTLVALTVCDLNGIFSDHFMTAVTAGHPAAFRSFMEQAIKHAYGDLIQAIPHVESLDNEGLKTAFRHVYRNEKAADSAVYLYRYLLKLCSGEVNLPVVVAKSVPVTVQAPLPEPVQANSSGSSKTQQLPEALPHAFRYQILDALVRHTQTLRPELTQVERADFEATTRSWLRIAYHEWLEANG